MYGKESGDVELFLREMEDVFDLADSRDLQQSLETGNSNYFILKEVQELLVDNLRKLWRFFKATESNYVSLNVRQRQVKSGLT